LATLMWAFIYFYCLLCSYYIIRPIRDTMGISAGVDSLQHLYLLTICLMLALVPLFGWLTSRWPRRKFLPFIYAFFVANLLVYHILFRFFSWCRQRCPEFLPLGQRFQSFCGISVLEFYGGPV
jgi:AAA family ATP:ADP antiporter